MGRGGARPGAGRKPNADGVIHRSRIQKMVTLPGELWQEIDAVVPPYKRSRWLEEIIRKELANMSQRVAPGAEE